MSQTPRPDRIPLVDQIEALLPQTQCTKCGTEGCRPYAEAVATGTPHNRCVPGGAETIAELSALLSLPPLPLDPAFGVEPTARRVAFIREAECIGCTKCLQACPVDAIVGAAKLMHTVITDECTGCDLCIPPCPVDCIDMHELPKITEPAAKKAAATQYRQRFEARRERLATQAASASTVQQAPAPSLQNTAAAPATSANANTAPATTTSAAKPAGSDDKARVIAAALARTQLKKAEKRLASARENGEATSALEAEVEKLQAEVKRLG